MKIIVNIEGSRLHKIDNLISARKYVDAYQLVNHAIDTLINIEEGTDEQGSLVTNAAKTSSLDKKNAFSFQEVIGRKEFQITLSKTNIPQELWSSLKNGEETWLWGQINSVLAIKFCVRALANILHKRKASFIPLELFIKELEAPLADIRLYLINLDEIYQRERDAKCSRSFPSQDEKSQVRFETQYIGTLKKHGWTEGAIVSLGFARLDPKDLTLGLTDYGMKFASAKNPIFDDPIDPAVGNLSQEEAEIYLTAVKEFSVPERNSLSTIGSLILSGNDTPKLLDSALSERKPRWTTAQVMTYRVGAIARLLDLNMLQKTKKSYQEIKYSIKMDFFNKYLSATQELLKK